MGGTKISDVICPFFENGPKWVAFFITLTLLNVFDVARNWSFCKKKKNRRRTK